MDYVKWFTRSYSSALLHDEQSLNLLEMYVTRMQAKFQGVYQACVHDLLQKESGFHAAVGLGAFLQEQVAPKSQHAKCAVAEDNIAMYETSVMTQELLIAYVAELARKTEGRMPSKNGTKHLWRIIEKQCFAPTQQQASIWDVSRTYLEFETMGQLLQGLEQLHKDHDDGQIQIIRVKQRFSQPTSGGWSDILVNLCFPSEDIQVPVLPCEIQFVHGQLMTIRQDMGAHKIYSKFRIASEMLELQALSKFSPEPVLPVGTAGKISKDMGMPPVAQPPLPPLSSEVQAPPPPPDEHCPALPGSIN
jgi:hypothetical protein